ncbi:hypothetical protein KA107_03010 [Candidatus Pacearchaeota archaeon]|nr:hypothetical protein [Candidatus Pacearchaeota archaeon]
MVNRLDIHGPDLKELFLSRMNHLEISEKIQRKVTKLDIDSFYAHEKVKQAEHIMGVAIIGEMVDEYFGLTSRQKRDMWVIRCAHDRGKLNKVCLPYVDRVPFDDGMMRYIEYHVDPAAIPKKLLITAELIPAARSGTHTHHIHQRFRKPYPEVVRMPITPESDLISKLIALPDCTQSAIHRNGVIPTQEASLARVMADYNNLKFSYVGGVYFPRIESTGEKVIVYLKDLGVFSQ